MQQPTDHETQRNKSYYVPTCVLGGNVQRDGGRPPPARRPTAARGAGVLPPPILVIHVHVVAARGAHARIPPGHRRRGAGAGAGRPRAPAAVQVTLLSVRGEDDAPAYKSADRVSAAEGTRFEVYAGKEGLAAEGAFARRNGGWRVECHRPVASHSRVAEVLVLAEGGVLVRARARASAARRIGCATRLEGIPEEECGCGACGDEWEMVGHSDDEFKEHEEEAEAETMRWALEMGAWAVCVGVELLATSRRFSRRRPALR